MALEKIGSSRTRPPTAESSTEHLWRKHFRFGCTLSDNDVAYTQEEKLRRALSEHVVPDTVAALSACYCIVTRSVSSLIASAAARN